VTSYFNDIRVVNEAYQIGASVWHCKKQLKYVRLNLVEILYSLCSIFWLTVMLYLLAMVYRKKKGEKPDFAGIEIGQSPNLLG
jgi:hypothetical protein